MSGLLLAGLTLAGCSSSGSTVHTSGAAPRSATGTNTTAAATTSGQVVLHPSDAPAGTQYLAKASGPKSIADTVKGDPDAAKEIAQLKHAGFRDAYLSVFTGLQLPPSIRRGHLVDSFAVVFRSPASAVNGLPILIRIPLAGAPQTGTTPTTGLGPHARGVRLAITALPGDSYLYAWTQGNTVRLLIDGGGTGVVTAAAALQLARRVQATPVAGTAGAALAARAVLQSTDKPADTELIAARSGARTLTQFTPAKGDAAALRRLGFVAGNARQYLSPGLVKPSSARPVDARQSNYIASEAQRYDAAANAHRAYILFRAREQKVLGNRAARLATPDLGPDATAFRYLDHRSTGDLIGYVYFWRHGSFMLSLFDVGTTSFASPATAAKLARTMDANASR